MATIPARSPGFGNWSASKVGAVWRAFDLQIATYAALLTCFGLAMAYSNSTAGGGEALGPGSTFVRGLMWAGLALIVFVVATAFDYHWLKTFAWPLYFVQIGLLTLTLAVGTGVGGSSRWVTFGGVQFQFSELAKILMIVVLANFLASRQGRLSGVLPVIGACILVGPPLLLVLMQPDLGTSLVFGAILFGMLFMSGASLRWLGGLVAAGLAAFPFIWTYVLKDDQKERLTAFLNPLADIQGSGYQLYQAQVAVSSGGLFGKGLTNGSQSALGFLPANDTDFVSAVLGEELGFVGILAVVLLFVLLLWRLLVGAWRSKDPFGLMFGAGMAAMILFQLVVNLGMVLGLMPITGIPLPFVTYGGASLISIAAGLGILESINIRQGRAEW